MRNWLLVLCGLITVAVVSACGDGGTAKPTATPTIEETATVEPSSPTTSRTPAARRTGIPELDAFIDALIADHGQKEKPALSALLGFTQIACTATPAQGIGGPPVCQLNEEDGELVDVFPTASCEGAYLRPHEIGQVLDVLGESTVYAIYRTPPGRGFVGDYIAVISDQAERRAGLAWAVEIDDAKIVGLSFSCAAAPGEFVESSGLEDAVLPPPTP